jgi:hypothetical protein
MIVLMVEAVLYAGLGRYCFFLVVLLQLLLLLYQNPFRCNGQTVVECQGGVTQAILAF